MNAHVQVPVHLRRNVFDLAPEMSLLRAKRPVGRMTLPNGVKAWLVSDYRHVREVLSDASRFSSDGREIPDPETGVATATAPGAASLHRDTVRHGDITRYDPPEHSRLRRILGGAFAPKRIARLQADIEVIVNDTLASMERNGRRADLVESFAMAVPSMVICALLGVPYADRAEFQQRAITRFDSSLDPHTRETAVRESLEYMSQLVHKQRHDPGEALIGRMVREHGDAIDDHELTGLCDLLLLGGHETTANVLALGTLLLLLNPEYVKIVVSEGEELPQLVDETIRYLSVVQTGVPRVATMDTELADQHIRRGDRILCSLPSANRDAAVFEHPEEFTPSREPGTHMAFGHGIHYCIGAHLARLELRIGLSALFKKFPGLHLSIPVEDLSFRTTSAVYGLTELPVGW